MNACAVVYHMQREWLIMMDAAVKLRIVSHAMAASLHLMAVPTPPKPALTFAFSQ